MKRTVLLFPLVALLGCDVPDDDLPADTTITEPETLQIPAGQRKNVQLQQSAVVTLPPGARLCAGQSDSQWQKPVSPGFVYIYDQPKGTIHITVNCIALPRGLYHDLRIYGLNDWLIAHRVSSESQVCMTRNINNGGDWWLDGPGFEWPNWGARIVSYIQVFDRWDATVCGS